MEIAWTENLTVKFLVLYGRYELLRYPFHPKFRDQLCRYKAYKQIVESMNVPGLTVCDCVKRIAFLRRQYCHELSKISISIYSGKYYKPRIKCFEILHELFFPLTQYCDCLEDPEQDVTCLTDEEEDDDDDPSIRNDDIDENNDSANDYDCLSLQNYNTDIDHFITHDIDHKLLYNPCKNRQCPKAHKTKLREYSKVSNERLYLETGMQADIKQKKVSTKTSTSRHRKTSRQVEAKVPARDKSTENAAGKNHSKWSQTGKKHVNVGIDIWENCVTERGAQTDNKIKENYVNDVNAANRKQDVKRCGGSARDVRSYVRNTSNKKYDEYDCCGKSIANQLKNVDFERAISLEERMQKMISEEQLYETEQDFKDTYCKHVCNCDCSHSCVKCMEYKKNKKKETCSCGLPTNECLPPILAKATNSYKFCCN